MRPSRSPRFKFTTACASSSWRSNRWSQSPVAIDFGADGKLWVAEMRDYGCKDGETCPPNGRVSVLEDRDRDGKFETATVFLDKIAQPMGVTVWKKGVLISAAPDFIYAEDTNGDNKADVVEKMFTGFSVENPQARLNSLAVGLDGWYQGGCMFVGKIQAISKVASFNIGNRDFRIRPDTGEIDGENGQTENARVRDDWGNWFGCENGSLAMHFPISDRYLRRSPNLVSPPASIHIAEPRRGEAVSAGQAGAVRAFRSGRKSHGGVRHHDFIETTCGAPSSPGNAFTCEPVNQMVHRMILEPKGTTFVAEPAPEDEKSEFLTSTDNWFRPVQARRWARTARCGLSICTATSSNTRVGFRRRRKKRWMFMPGTRWAGFTGCRSRMIKRCRGRSSINSKPRGWPARWIPATARGET